MRPGGSLGRGAAREVGVTWLLVKAGVIQPRLPGALAEVVAVDSGHDGVLCKGTPSRPVGSGGVVTFYRPRALMGHGISYAPMKCCHAAAAGSEGPGLKLFGPRHTWSLSSTS